MKMIKFPRMENRKIHRLVYRIWKRVRRKALVKKLFSLYFKEVRISRKRMNRLKYGSMCAYCRHPYLTPGRTCSISKNRIVTADEEGIVDGISDYLNAYMEDVHHLGLGAKPFKAADGSWTFVISEKGDW